MLIELIDKLIDRCIALAREGQKVRKDLLVNFGNPLLAQFERVHDNYLETFRRYRALLNDANTPIDPKSPAFNAIREDIVFASGYRRRLAAMANVTNDPLFGELVAELRRYLQTPLDLEHAADDPFPPELCNFPRETLLDDLYNVINGVPIYQDSPELAKLIKTDWAEYTKVACLKVIDGVVLQLQRRYGDVQEAYERAKRKMLA